MGVIDSRRHFAGLCSLWYPVVCNLHRFFIATARAAVHEDEFGGTAVDPCVWSGGSAPKKEESSGGVRVFAFSSWASSSLGGGLVSRPPNHVLTISWHGRALSAHWSSFLLFLVPCIGLLRRVILGLGGVLSSVSFGQRSVLFVRKPFLGSVEVGRPVSVSAALVGPGNDFWKSCRFLGCVLRSLRVLPGGIHMFLPCDIGGDHGSLRHGGREGSGHELTSRPRGTSSRIMLAELLSLLGYPLHSGDALLGGLLPLKHCKCRLGVRSPSWRLRSEEVGLVSISVAASLPAPACVLSGGGGRLLGGRTWRFLKESTACQKKTPRSGFFTMFGKHQGSSTPVDEAFLWWPGDRCEWEAAFATLQGLVNRTTGDAKTLSSLGSVHVGAAQFTVGSCRHMQLISSTRYNNNHNRNHHRRPQTTTTTATTTSQSSVFTRFMECYGDLAGCCVGSARRRREWRLRS